ncbi:MAG: oligosaccharide flippase family protein [Saprospiraceae bacterium]
MSSFRYSIRNLITKLLVTGLAFLIYLFIPKFLGPDLFGTFSFLSAFVGLLIPLTSMGSGAGIIYTMSSKQFLLPEVFSTILRIGLLIAILNAILLFLFYKLGMLNLFEVKINLKYTLLFAVGVFFQTLSFILGRVFFGNSDFKILNLIEFSTSLLNPILLLAFLFFFGKENHLFLYVSFSIFSILIFLIHLYFVRKYNFLTEIKSDFVKKSFRYGLRSWPGDLALRANLRLDQLILVSSYSASALGIYSIAVKFVELVWMIPDSIGPVLFNLIASKKNPAESLPMVAKVHRLLIYACLFILFSWALICYYIMIPYFLGIEYKSVMIPFLLLIPGTLFLISSKIFTKQFSASGNVHWTSQITIFGFIISFIAYFTLIPYFGMNGAALASSIGYTALAFAGLYKMKTNYSIQLTDYYQFRISDWVWLKNQFIRLSYHRKNLSS